MSSYFHSVTLDEDKCRGCTNCIKRCPTEAIRVRKSKARIIKERCIDCGECIRVCPYHAKKAITDPFEMLLSYRYRVAIPAPSLYGQFKAAKSRIQILSALKMIGFDEVFEVAIAAEIVTEATKELMKKSGMAPKPFISSACPAVVRLIQVRFPNLIDNVIKLDSPMEVAAKIVKERTARGKGIPDAEVGVFFITPCAAKATSVKAPYEREKSFVDGVISIKDIYVKMLNSFTRAGNDEAMELAGFEGVRWASSGGESLALGIDNFLAVDGIHNVISILDEVENDRLEDVDFIEALACTGGCLSGPLTVENLYVAKSRIKKFVDEAKNGELQRRVNSFEDINLNWSTSMEYKPVMKLDTDLSMAMKKLEKMEIINDGLPGLDCGACGAPSCRALAEDIVRGMATETDCIFKLREKVRNLTIQMIELETKMPPVLDKGREEEEGE